MTADDDTPQAWERMQGEPARCYNDFRVYRDMPPGIRSIDATAADPRSSGVKPRQLRTIAVRWQWRARAEAWDDECARVEDSERLDQIRQMHATHRKVARSITTLAVRALQGLHPSEVPPAAAVRLLELGTRLERTTLAKSVAELQGVEEAAGDDPWERIARELDPATASDR